MYLKTENSKKVLYLLPGQYERQKQKIIFRNDLLTGIRLSNEGVIYEFLIL